MTNGEQEEKGKVMRNALFSFQILPDLRVATPVSATQKNETFKELIINYSTDCPLPFLVQMKLKRSSKDVSKESKADILTAKYTD